MDRTRSRLDIPALRTLFGLKARPHRNRTAGPPAQDIVIDKPRHGLSWFRVRSGRLQLKASPRGEHVLRFEATGHSTNELRCRRGLDNFAQISPCWPGWPTGSHHGDCAGIGFLPDGRPDELPAQPRPGRAGSPEPT